MEEEEPGSVPWWSELNAVGLSVPTPLFLSALRDLRETLVMLVPVENQDGLARRYTPSQPGWTRESSPARAAETFPGLMSYILGRNWTQVAARRTIQPRCL